MMKRPPKDKVYRKEQTPKFIQNVEMFQPCRRCCQSKESNGYVTKFTTVAQDCGIMEEKDRRGRNGKEGPIEA